MTNDEMMNGDGLDDGSSGFKMTIRAENVNELRDILDGACEKVTEMYGEVNAEIHKVEREKAFIRYCFTGRFE